MYDKVIVPLDGSRLAEVALPYAEEIAGKVGCAIILLTVLESEEAQENREHHAYTTKIVEATRRHVEKYVHNPERNAINVGSATRVGNAAEGIIDYINSGTLDLIVMATHGRSGVSRWAMGSVADKVVRATTRQPLLLIRANKGGFPDVRAKRILKKALVPLDGSRLSESVVPYVTALAQKLNMEITLLQITTKNNHTDTNAEDYLQGWCRRFEENGVSASYEIRAGAPADQIIDIADELVMDMVTMSTHGQNAINLWPLGSVAQKVLLAGSTPLLLIRA
jgi:nucleotide-binding universal stress UspA family protein